MSFAIVDVTFVSRTRVARHVHSPLAVLVVPRRVCGALDEWFAGSLGSRSARHENKVQNTVQAFSAGAFALMIELWHTMVSARKHRPQQVSSSCRASK